MSDLGQTPLRSFTSDLWPALPGTELEARRSRPPGMAVAAHGVLGRGPHTGLRGASSSGLGSSPASTTCYPCDAR